MKKKRFKIGETFYNIPENEVSAFISDNPDAIEVRNYAVNGKNYNVPLNETEEFESDFGLKKKETVGVASLAGAGIGGTESSRTLSPFREDFRTAFNQTELPVSRNPRASISELTDFLDSPEDERDQLKSKILSGDIESAKEVVKQAKTKLKQSHTVTNTAPIGSPLLMGSGTQTESISEDYYPLVKKIDEDTESYISTVRMEQPYNSLKQVGEAIRKDLFDVGVTKNGNPYQELKVKAKLAGRTGDINLPLGRTINVENTKEESDYNNYVSGLVGRATYLGNKINDLTEISKDKLDELNSLDKESERAKELRKDPDIANIGNLVNEYYEIRDYRLPNSAVSFPHVKFMQERQKVKEFVGNRMKENLISLDANFKSPDQDINDISELLGVSKERAAILYKSTDIPSLLGQAWRSAGSMLESQELGLRRIFGSPDLLSKSIEQSQIAHALPESLTSSSKNINLLSSLYTAADTMGQIGIFAAEGALGGELLGALGKGVAEALPTTPFFNPTPLMQSFVRAGQLGATFTSGFLSDYEPAYQEGMAQTNDEGKAKLYANWRAGITGVSELLLPDVDIAKRLAGVRKLTYKTFEDLAGKEGFSKRGFLAGLGEFGKIIVEENLEEQFPIIGTVLLQEGIFNRTIPRSELIDQSLNTAIAITIGTLPFGVIGGFRKPASSFKKANVYEASINPSEQIKNLQEAFQDGKISESKMNDGIKIVSTLSEINKGIENATDKNGNPLTENKKHDLTYSLLQQRLSEDAKKNIVPALAKFYDEDITSAQTSIDNIVSGEDEKTQLSDQAKLDEAKTLVTELAESDQLPNVYKQQAIDDPEGFLKFIHEQSADPKTTQATKDQFSETLVNTANDVFDLLPKEGTVQSDLTASEVVKGSEEAVPSIESVEKRMNDIQDEIDLELKNPKKDLDKINELQSEFNTLEKKAEKHERDSVFNVPLSEASKAVDDLIKKEKEMPNGFGSFVDKKDANESKSVIEKYIEPSKISDDDLRNDFTEALMGNPATWYADGLKLRESVNEATNRGIDIDGLLKEVEQKFLNDGYDSKTAKEVIARRLEPIFKKQQPNEQQTKPNEAISQATQTTEATATPVDQTTEVLPAGEGGVQENVEATIPVVQTEQEKVLTKPKIRVGSAQAEAAQIIAEEESKPIPEKNKAFHDKVDKAASSLIKALSAKLPEGTRKQGIGLEEIVNAAAAIVKKAYDLGTDIKAAIDEAVQYVKDQFKKEGLGDVDENVVRKHFEDSVSSVKQDAIKEKRKEVLQLRKALKDISEFSIAGLDKSQVEEIFSNRKNLTPQIQKIIDTVFDRLGQTEGTKQNEKIKEETKIAEGKKILDEVFSKIRKGQKTPRTFLRIASSDVSDLIPYLKDKFSTYKSISLNQLEEVADSLIDIFGVDIASQMVKDLDINEKPIAMAKIAIKLREEGRNQEAANMMAQLIQTGTATGQAIKSFDRIKTLIGSVTDPTFRTEFQKAMYERDEAIRNSVKAEFNLQSDEFKQKVTDLEKQLHEKTIDDNKSLLSKFIDRICGTRKKK